MLKVEEKKTGTTTLGIICKDGIILGADRRGTVGNMILEKKARKVHEVAENMVMTGAGSVSDILLLVKL